MATVPPASPNLSVRNAFASPIFETYLPDCGPLNDRLKGLFLDWEADTNRKRASVPTDVARLNVYESDFALFNRQDPEVAALSQFCMSCLSVVVKNINGYSSSEMANIKFFAHSWYHLTRKGGYTAQHNHPMASWSGVYCVDPGDFVADKPTNGALRFLESRLNAAMYLDDGNAHWRDPFTFGDLVFNLTAGQLLLFPSYLMHEVTLYHGERERITVAFNAWMRERGASGDVPYVRNRAQDR
ncbi:MAG TPA: putative 2OG-Fe(II) oxygenase [Gammaproteobacteria bacterium]|nr:putative 2OG-Fe(II) oxygenase [Gammaproteobacteria bacterium]